jgi:ribose 1,5-bisphosphate isomerase
MQKDLSILVSKIKNLEIQGAKQIAVESLKFLRSYVKEKGFDSGFDKAAIRLEKTRKTAVILHNCLEIVRKERSTESITRLLSRMNSFESEVGKRGARLIKNGDRIMTHCHSTEAMAIIKQAWKDGKKIMVYASMTEPKRQGLITAHELAKIGIPVILITDSAQGFYMKEADLVLVGSDAIRKEGLVNKIGTYMLATMAKKHGKPFYTATDTLKLDGRKKFEIEIRDPKEIYDEHISSMKILNPAFDITPWNLVTRVITEKGVMTPANILRMLR